MSATKFCQFCGKTITANAVVCPFCGQQVAPMQGQTYQQPPVYQNIYVTPGVPKNKWVAFLLCLFLGVFGAHKFYEGKIGMGILYIFTAGLLGIGWLVDIITILCKPETYYV